MMDIDAIIAQQKAEHAAREAIPGRYDGTPIKDIAAKVRAEHANLAAWRRSNPEPESRGDELDVVLRDLGVRSKQANAVYALAATAGYQVAPLSADGRPLKTSTHDLQQLIDWWSPSGEYATAWPGVPCRPGTFYGLQLWGQGLKWYDETRVVRPKTRMERLEEWITRRPVDLVTEAGVPPANNEWSEADPEARIVVRATMSAPLRMVEILAPSSPSSVEVFRGGAVGPDGLAALARTRPGAPQQTQWLCWSWPLGLELPLGHLRSGVRAVPALPGDGAQLILDGVSWRVAQWPVRFEVLPDWLAAAIQELA